MIPLFFPVSFSRVIFQVIFHFFHDSIIFSDIYFQYFPEFFIFSCQILFFCHLPKKKFSKIYVCFFLNYFSHNRMFSIYVPKNWCIVCTSSVAVFKKLFSSFLIFFNRLKWKHVFWKKEKKLKKAKFLNGSVNRSVSAGA